MAELQSKHSRSILAKLTLNMMKVKSRIPSTGSNKSKDMNRVAAINLDALIYMVCAPYIPADLKS